MQGVTSSQDALNAQNYTPQQQLALAQLTQSIPAQNLGLLAQIGVLIAGLGAANVSGTTQGTQQMSGAQQFGDHRPAASEIFLKRLHQPSDPICA